ncbi:MAG: PQQ-binding-like beta-propeller repeat protein [Verrucomicrobiales bacterium]
MRNRFLSTALGIPLLLSAPLQAQDWPRFHGKGGTGVSEVKTIPVDLSANDYNWDVKLPGTGHSSPVLWGDKIFLTATDREDDSSRSIICLSAKDGSVLWKKSEPFHPTRKHKYNDYSSSTPAVDEDHVYVAWSTPDVVLQARDHDGNEVWRKDLGKFHAAHGSAMSPVVAQGKVLLGNQIEEGESFIIALDAKSGKQVWKLPRKTVDKAAYGTPAMIGGGRAVYASTAHGVTCLDIDTGKVLWEHNPKFSLRCVGKPTVAGNYIFASGGNGGGRRESVGISVDGDQTEEVFSLSKHVPYVPSGVSYNGLIFLLNDGGQVTCLNPEDGEELWYERVTGEAYASPLVIDGKLYCFSREGEMAVIDAGDEFKELAKHDFGEGIFATPAISDGTMYVRTFNRLISIGGKK